MGKKYDPELVGIVENLVKSMLLCDARRTDIETEKDRALAAIAKWHNKNNGKGGTNDR